MIRPRALDLFCGGGGAAMGLYRAGFDIVGVDIKYHKNYPFPFIVHDALKVQQVIKLSDFDFVWASPPCQRFSKATPKRCRDSHPDLIEPVRDLLAISEQENALTCMENLPKAPLRPDIILDGVHFGLPLERRRIFEVNFDTRNLATGPRTRPNVRPEIRPEGGQLIDPKNGPLCQEQDGPGSFPKHGPKLGLPNAISVTGGGGPDKGTLEEWKAAMGIDWMTRRELVEAVPPAYSQAIGRCALAEIKRKQV